MARLRALNVVAHAGGTVFQFSLRDEQRGLKCFFIVYCGEGGRHGPFAAITVPRSFDVPLCRFPVRAMSAGPPQVRGAGDGGRRKNNYWDEVEAACTETCPLPLRHKDGSSAWEWPPRTGAAAPFLRAQLGSSLASASADGAGAAAVPIGGGKGSGGKLNLQPPAAWVRGRRRRRRRLIHHGTSGDDGEEGGDGGGGHTSDGGGLYSTGYDNNQQHAVVPDGSGRR